MKQFVPNFSEFSRVYEQVANEEEILKGGTADNRTLQDIADHHGVPLWKVQAEYKKGIIIEKEHTSNDAEAKEIVKDHLWEFADYYTRLDKAEK